MVSLSQVIRRTAVAAVAVVATGCAAAGGGGARMGAPVPDPRVGLRAGILDAQEAIWNLKVLSKTPPPKDFVGETNSDLAFSGSYAIQGNYNGFQVWEIKDPTRPELVIGYVCPASQSDVAVYKHLLFISGEGLSGRLDCGRQGVPTAVSQDRLRGLRIFDISDIRHPRNVGNVQTCRGSHTHSVLVDPRDPEHVYVYISGSAGVRPAAELPGCSGGPLDRDPNSALFRIEVIKVPVKNPAAAAIVSSPRIFNDLVAPPVHGLAPDDKLERDELMRRAAFVATVNGEPFPLSDRFANSLLADVVKARGGTGAPTAADSAKLREELPARMARMFGAGEERRGPRPGPTQCHDITLYPGIGLAGGACEGYGLLLDISDPANPKRLAAVADSNFSYWHSATFNNDGTSVLFTDEWGGGGGPKCRASDPKEWGANAIFTIVNGQMQFQSYYKMPAAQTKFENCVAHNGSLIPIPGRDIMVQSWYQGGISVFEFTEPKKPVEIAFHDRGPADSTQMGDAGSWSVYWYNGVIVSSEIGRGLDIFELTPSAYITQNEIDAAKTVRLEYLNAQGQPKFEWPASFALARAYADQLERSKGVSAARLKAVREGLATAESVSGSARSSALSALAARLDGDVAGSKDGRKVTMLASAMRALAR